VHPSRRPRQSTHRPLRAERPHLDLAAHRHGASKHRPPRGDFAANVIINAALRTSVQGGLVPFYLFIVFAIALASAIGGLLLAYKRRPVASEPPWGIASIGIAISKRSRSPFGRGPQRRATPSRTGPGRLVPRRRSSATRSLRHERRAADALPPPSPPVDGGRGDPELRSTRAGIRERRRPARQREARTAPALEEDHPRARAHHQWRAR